VQEKYGPSADRWYRLGFNALSFLTFIPVIWLLRVMHDKLVYFIPLPWAIITLIVQSLGFIIIVMGIRQTGLVPFLGIEPLLPDDRLIESSGFVRTGIYSWIRHPLYVGAMLIIWPATSMTVNLLVFLILCTIYFGIGAKLEENRHREEFGEAYVKYQQEVPMLIPDFRQLIKEVGK
jgi:protein-S-isoprenylcysteine O-methyltransferase Ste14